tara:strand:+ start:165 stop:653 length:489 start_codon:yes stop_codon:yes gene_type:complete
MRTITIQSEQQLRYCRTMLDEMPLDGSKTVVFKNTDKSSTAKQRRLQWLWYTEVAASGLGQDDTKDAVHVRSKWMFARPILLRDDDVFQILYETFMQAISTHDAHLKSKYAREFTDQYISTERLSKAQRAEYLTEFQRYWVGHGVDLTDPATQGLDLRRWRR